MKTTIRKHRELLGRAKEGYVCEIEGTGLSVTGKDKESTVDYMELSLSLLYSQDGKRRYIRTNNATFCLVHSWLGWQYDIVRDDNPDKPSVCMFGEMPVDDAYAIMKKHADQYEN